MNIWEPKALVLFILFFVPGFIALKVYDLLVPGEVRKPADSVVEAVAYSCVNYAVFSWLIYLDFRFDWANSSPSYHAGLLVFLLLISPIGLSVGLWYLRQRKFMQRIVRHPLPRPWDYVFSKGEWYWIIIELKDGKRVGGVYNTDSFASSFPHAEQIYLEECWEVSDRAFLKPIDRSKGIIISNENIRSIEFYK
jgi:hypothetical protein